MAVKISRLVKSQTLLLLLLACGSSFRLIQADEPLFPVLRRLQQVRCYEHGRCTACCPTSTVLQHTSKLSSVSHCALQDPANSTDTIFSHDLTWNSLFHHQPMQHHHAGYKFMLSKQQRQRGISHYGSAERLRAALSRAVTSECYVDAAKAA